MASDNAVLNLAPFKVAESNVFFMSRFRNTRYHMDISDAVAEGVRAFGLEFLRADYVNVQEPFLWPKIKLCMEASRFGVALFETIDEPDHNPNINLELGYMLALKRPCLLLKERRLRVLPTDLCGFLYNEFDSYDIKRTVLGEVAAWLKQIEVRKRDHQKLIVFVSYAGQDRCSIAKAITNHLLAQHFNFDDVHSESRAAFRTYGPTAAKTGVKVVQQKLKKDWLSEHRPRRAGPAFLFEADLILATDGLVLNELQNSFMTYPETNAGDQSVVRDEINKKLDLVTKFFGSSGDLKDPFPDNEDAESLQRYEEYFEFVNTLISKNIENLYKFLERPYPPKDRVRTVAFGNRTLFGTSPID